METPSKQAESSSMTHEEEEKTQHDISILRNQVQQISLTQKVTKNMMDGLKKDVEAKMNGVEAKMDGVESKMNGMETKMDNLKTDLKIGMEDLKIDLTKFLQEMLTNGERVVNETHDEKRVNVNHDFIDSNVGSKNHHVRKIDMRKDPITWILQMEQFFNLHNVQNTQKVRIATLYLEPNQFVWYRWLCSHKNFFTWAIFTDEMIAHYEDTKRNNFLAN